MSGTIRIKVNNREKKLIDDYCLSITTDIKSQLQNKRRKTIDVMVDEINDIIGSLSMECNHRNNRNLMFELNELCERLESVEEYYS